MRPNAWIQGIHSHQDFLPETANKASGRIHEDQQEGRNKTLPIWDGDFRLRAYRPPLPLLLDNTSHTQIQDSRYIIEQRLNPHFSLLNRICQSF